MKTYQRVFAKINLNNVEDNLEGMRALVHAKASAEKSRFFAVIKTDGYGHGAVPIAFLLEEKDFVHGYAVATAEEALELRKAGVRKPILILGYTFPESYELLAKYEIMPTVFREDSLESLSRASEKSGHKIKVHVKVDTGMNRIGIAPDERGISFIEKVIQTKGIELQGIFTHFARADEEDKSFAIKQMELFGEFVDQTEEALNIKIPCKHCANSAAIMELPQSYMEFVRAGISLYGLWPSEEMNRNTMNLKPAMALYSHVVYIKEIEKGAQVSYGGTFQAKKPMRIATIPVGYGDGYPRGLSGVGYVLIRGRKAPILGRVCMDQFMVDVTDIPEAAMDDLVTLIGKDGDESITMEELGNLSGRFNYELACDLGKRIPRIYTYDENVVSVKDFYAE